MSDEWVLVPIGTVDWRLTPDDGWQRDIPPIPRQVWDAMVERAENALWVEGKNADAALRAALGNPEVEP